MSEQKEHLDFTACLILEAQLNSKSQGSFLKATVSKFIHLSFSGTSTCFVYRVHHLGLAYEHANIY